MRTLLTGRAAAARLLLGLGATGHSSAHALAGRRTGARRTLTLAIRAARRPMKLRISRLIRHPAVRPSRMPLVARLYERADECGVPHAFYRYSLRHDLAHNASHVLMFAFGGLFWWPRAGADHLPGACPVAAA